jgi:hypothetical protein
MIDPKQLRKYIIEPVLKKLDMCSEAAVNLELGTAAVESQMGRYLHQIKGIALGIYQIEPATYYDTMENYVAYRPHVVSVLDSLMIKGLSAEENLIGNLYYSTAISRLKYYRSPEPLPEHDNIEGLGIIWKRVYNTYKGKGTLDGFIRCYEKYIAN